ncbi:MAG: acyl-CoA dehydrogenase family protein [Deltaproteobacteria bacterium]|nr:acyl-CoA dehydrogenase family protein [Deltaproteobacteria bacterium]
MIRNTARDFATREVLPQAAAIDRTHQFPRDVIAKLGALGLMGVAVPQSWGGAGMDTVSYVLALEEISRACAATGVIMSVNNSLVCAPILAHGTDAQRGEWLPDLASGRKLGCFALSEPESGSDASALRTSARRAEGGGGWILNGTKNFVTNGPVADVVLLLASVDPAAGAKGISAFLVDTRNPGLKFGPPDDKMGIRGAPSAQLFITDAAVPDNALLGAPGSGYKIALGALDGGRIGIAAQALGIARAAFEDATTYALQRKTFGQPIARHQAIEFKLADMCTEIDAARLMIWRAAVKKDQGGRYTTEAAMAKLLASEVANRAAKEAVQVFGGYGYLTDFPVEHHFRDAKITEIYEGTSEIQRLVIARNVLESSHG